MIYIGAAINAAGFQLFFFPNSILAGDVTGISTIINHLAGVPVGAMSILINIPLFIYKTCSQGTRP